MICVIDVIEGPAKGKRIWLKENQSLEVGRLSSVDFAIPADNHLSRRHLRLDSQGMVFRVHDEGSANGTYLNNERVTDGKLHSGDTIRAGKSKFTVSFLPDGENPHSSDGVTFQTMPSFDEPIKSPRTLPSEPPVGGRTISFSHPHDLEKTSRLAPSAIPALLNQDRNRYISKWWLPHFKSLDSCPVYEQMKPIGDQGTDFVTLTQSFMSSCDMLMIVNRSQLTLAGEVLLSQLEANESVRPLMHPLYLVPSQIGNLFWPMLEECLGQDAMICVGVRKSGGLPALTQFASSIGFPSLFGIHITSPESNLAASMLEHVACVIFEWNQDGKIGLVIDA